jgi:hypothetical protein
MVADLTGTAAGGLLELELPVFLLVVVLGLPLLVDGVAAGFGARAGTVVFGAGFGWAGLALLGSAGFGLEDCAGAGTGADVVGVGVGACV